MPKTLKKKCCKKFRRKGKACRGCPLMERLGKRQRKELLAGHRSDGKRRRKRKELLTKKRKQQLKKLRGKARGGKT